MEHTRRPRLHRAPRKLRRVQHLLRRAFNEVADLPLGPRDASMLIERIRELAQEIHATGPAG